MEEFIVCNQTENLKIIAIGLGISSDRLTLLTCLEADLGLKPKEKFEIISEFMEILGINLIGEKIAKIYTVKQLSDCMEENLC